MDFLRLLVTNVEGKVKILQNFKVTVLFELLLARLFINFIEE